MFRRKRWLASAQALLWDLLWNVLRTKRSRYFVLYVVLLLSFIWYFIRDSLSSPALLGHSRSAQLCRFAPLAPLNFVASLLCMASLNFVASFLCSAQLWRFAPVAPLSFLASRSIAQPTDNPIEKLCSALNSCWLEKKKRPFSNGRT